MRGHAVAESVYVFPVGAGPVEADPVEAGPVDAVETAGALAEQRTLAVVVAADAVETAGALAEQRMLAEQCTLAVVVAADAVETADALAVQYTLPEWGAFRMMDTSWVVVFVERVRTKVHIVTFFRRTDRFDTYACACSWQWKMSMSLEAF